MPKTFPDLPLGFALVEVTRLLRQRMDRELEEAGLGVTAGEARALAYAAQYRGQRQAVLAERMGVEPMTLVGYLDRLEAHGLVRREPDPTDRRAKIVVLTEASTEVLAQIRKLSTSVREGVTRGLSPEEVAGFRSALALMRDNLLGASNEVAA